MQRELDAQLVKDHPILFRDRHGDMRQTCMVWGFECGDGWYDLLEEAADKLEPLCRALYEDSVKKEKSWYPYIRNAIALTARFCCLYSTLYRVVNLIQPNVFNNAIYFYGGPPCRASQIKEKFGTLRFYMTSQTKEMGMIIDKAVRRSAVTCEQCGLPGKLRGSGWYYTACNKHKNSR